MKKVLNVIKNVFMWLVVALAVFMVIFTIISVNFFNKTDRNLFGYRVFIVLSDSMSATDFDAGDLIFVKETEPWTLEEGDVITYLSQEGESFGEIVTHKIRSKSVNARGEKGFVTYGTTTGVDDVEIVTYTYILGKYQFRIPKLGHFFYFMKTPPGYILLILVPFLLLILHQGIKSIRLFKAYRNEQRKALEAEKEKIEQERQETAAMLQELQALKAELERKIEEKCSM